MKIGETYYVIAQFLPDDCYKPYITITRVEITEKRGKNTFIGREIGGVKWYAMKNSYLGKSVFATKEEAEKALAELKKEIYGG